MLNWSQLLNERYQTQNRYINILCNNIVTDWLNFIKEIVSDYDPEDLMFMTGLNSSPRTDYEFLVAYFKMVKEFEGDAEEFEKSYRLRLLEIPDYVKKLYQTFKPSEPLENLRQHYRNINGGIEVMVTINLTNDINEIEPFGESSVVSDNKDEVKSLEDLEKMNDVGVINITIPTALTNKITRDPNKLSSPAARQQYYNVIADYVSKIKETLAHELTHVVQDAQVNLDTRTKHKEEIYIEHYGDVDTFSDYFNEFAYVTQDAEMEAFLSEAYKLFKEKYNRTKLNLDFVTCIFIAISDIFGEDDRDKIIKKKNSLEKRFHTYSEGLKLAILYAIHVWIPDRDKFKGHVNLSKYDFLTNYKKETIKENQWSAWRMAQLCKKYEDFDLGFDLDDTIQAAFRKIPNREIIGTLFSTIKPTHDLIKGFYDQLKQPTWEEFDEKSDKSPAAQ